MPGVLHCDDNASASSCAAGASLESLLNLHDARTQAIVCIVEEGVVRRTWAIRAFGAVQRPGMRFRDSRLASVAGATFHRSL